MIYWASAAGRRRRRFRCDAFPSGGPLLVLEGIDGARTPSYRRPTVGLGTANAAITVAHALGGSCRHGWVEVCGGASATADGWCASGDTIVLGGPKHNPITDAALRAFGGHSLARPDRPAPTRFAPGDGPGRAGPADRQVTALALAIDGDQLVWFGQRYGGEVTDDRAPARGRSGAVGRDYGVVLRLPSYPNPRHRMTVLFGAQTFGVEAAARWLVGLADHRGAWRRFTRPRHSAALVSARVDGGVVGRPELLDLVVLPEMLVPRHLRPGGPLA